MRLTFSRLILFMLSLSSAHAFGADLNCKVEAAVRCICPASMTVDCGSGFSGWIDDEEKPKSIEISVYDPKSGMAKKVVIDNPPKGIRSYYAGLDSDPYVTRKLGDAGITINSKTQLNLVSAKFGDNLTLYEDHKKAGPKNKSQAVADTGYEYNCFYTDTPSILKGSSCDASICSGRAKCWKGDKAVGETAVSCRSKDGISCPSASACGADPDVNVANAEAVTKDQFEENLKSKAVQ